YTETVRNAADGLLGLINDILDFSKIESGKLELEEIPFDLRYIVESVGELMARGAHEKGLELTCFVHPESTVKLMGDPERLRQVLVNLASNAIKFTEKGNIDIRVEAVWEGEDRTFLRFEVVDTGIGIPEDRLNSIFESFTQADGSTTRRRREQGREGEHLLGHHPVQETEGNPGPSDDPAKCEGGPYPDSGR
ncbi:MAG: hypothetical protein JRH00_11480, partial [Deltaproteobacteria bacterium]|nr:hypothetical protein [Deltaproteobacteria bacterium]